LPLSESFLPLVFFRQLLSRRSLLFAGFSRQQSSLLMHFLSIRAERSRRRRFSSITTTGYRHSRLALGRSFSPFTLFHYASFSSRHTPAESADSHEIVSLLPPPPSILLPLMLTPPAAIFIIVITIFFHRLFFKPAYSSPSSFIRCHCSFIDY
jgi:hypothetical protein